MQRLGIKFALVCAVLTALTLAVAGGYRFRGRPSGPVDRASIDQMRLKLHEVTRQWVLKQDYERPNGEGVKTVDLGVLLFYFARAGDHDSYLRVRDYLYKHMRPDEPEGSYADGLIFWVYYPDRPAVLQDTCSGTTEMLRTAKGLWEGAKQFKDPADRAWALKIVQAYLRHQTEEGGHWFIANYIKIRYPALEAALDRITATQPSWSPSKIDPARLPPHGQPIFHKSNNSFLVDYDPDFLHEVAKETGDAGVEKCAALSDDLIKQATVRFGGGKPGALIMDMVRPEIATLMPESLWVYAPNGVIGLGNAASIAEMSIQGNPDTARGVLTFSRRWPANGLDNYYTIWGERWTQGGIKDPGYYTFCPLARLACKLNDQMAAREYVKRATGYTDGFIRHPWEPRIHTAGEMLVTMQEAMRQSDLE